MPAGYDFVAIAAGTEHGVALRSDGSLVSWGHNGSGQVSGTPAGNDFVALAAGSHHSVAQRSNGSLVSWGHNDRGQISGTPTGTDIVAFDAGGDYSMAIRAQNATVGAASSGTLDRKSGAVSFFGSVSCSPWTVLQVLVTLEQQQTKGKSVTTVVGSERIEVDCRGNTIWMASVRPTRGKFAAGAATARAEVVGLLPAVSTSQAMEVR